MEMSKSIRTITINELQEIIIDYRGKTPKKSECGIRLITAKVVKDGEIKNDRAEYITSEYFDQWMTRGLAKRTILL